jgi:hypothetical protein
MVKITDVLKDLLFYSFRHVLYPEDYSEYWPVPKACISDSS